MNRQTQSACKESSRAFGNPQPFHAAQASRAGDGKRRGIQDCRKNTLLTLIFAALMAVCCGQIYAQAGIDMGSITGTVKDPSRGIGARAQCTLTNTDTGEAQKTVSTSAGAYTFTSVPVGTYSLKVVAPGFKDLARRHRGSPRDTVTEDIALQVGAATEQVTVTSAAPLLQAQDASLGMTMRTRWRPNCRSSAAAAVAAL